MCLSGDHPAHVPVSGPCGTYLVNEIIGLIATLFSSQSFITSPQQTIDRNSTAKQLRWTFTLRHPSTRHDFTLPFFRLPPPVSPSHHQCKRAEGNLERW